MTSLSINQKKLIRSLDRKKTRQETGLFLVEGDKIVRELIASATSNLTGCKPEIIVATDDWLDEFRGSIAGGIETCSVKVNELRQVSALRQPNRAMAVVKQMDYKLEYALLRQNICLVLETIQDPGNLGTIIRTADWFGVRDIICSEDSVDLYNPKVIQSTMGSFLRVRVHYTDLPGLVKRMREAGKAGKTALDADTSGSGNSLDYIVFGTSGQGETLYKASLPSRGMILLGNESRGLSEELMDLTDRVLKIPPHDPDIHAESLNVSTAAAILCAEFRRQNS
ncbi:MAG TPA: RNA methyltransferase [Bacteroides sp.]|nr:RNA methyltransferase [Bacteroides sp.]